MRGWERLLRAGRPAPFFFARRFVLCLTLCCAAGLCLGRTSGYAPWLWLFPVSLLAAAWLLRCFLPVCRLALGGALFSLGLTPRCRRWGPGRCTAWWKERYRAAKTASGSS